MSFIAGKPPGLVIPCLPVLYCIAVSPFIKSVHGIASFHEYCAMNSYRRDISHAVAMTKLPWVSRVFRNIPHRWPQKVSETNYGRHIDIRVLLFLRQQFESVVQSDHLRKATHFGLPILLQKPSSAWASHGHDLCSVYEIPFSVNT